MTICYLTNDLMTSYNCNIWQGIKKVCEQGNVNFLNFSGGELNSPHTVQYPRNKVYDLVNKKGIDGIIINSTTLFHYANQDGIHDFYKRFQNIPVVNIGVKVKNIPTVLVDNKSGIYNGMIHFIKEHGYRKIAFIKGPGTNQESRLRFTAYMEALEEYKIKFDPDLIEQGDFSNHMGLECFKKLMRKNKKIDAIVAANDDMAIGAMNKAQEIGIVVPNELAIMGFDDIDEARYASIPLTTVCQPFFEQAKKAVEMLSDFITKKEIPGDTVLPTKLIIRRSCGCFSETMLNAQAIESKTHNTLTYKDLKKDISLNQVIQNKNIRHFNQYQWFMDLFVDYMETENPEKALSTMNMMLNKAAIDATLDIDQWQNILSDFIKFTFPYLQNDIPVLIKAENFWHQLRILIQEIRFHSQSYFNMISEQESINLRQASENLISIFDLKKLVESLMEELPRLGVKSCYLALYENRNIESEYSRLILAYSENGMERLPPGGIRYRTDELLPASIKSSGELNNYIIESLFFQEEQFGLIFFKINPQKNIFESIRQQISAAIKGALLVQNILEKENQLKSLLTEQNEWSKELEVAYKTLKENQERMIIMEKMASLGRMTAGIAHEMNTPLAAIRASLLELESLVKEYNQSITDPEVTADDHREISDEMKKTLNIAKIAGSRVAKFLQSVKFQTRDLSPKDHYLFNAVEIIKDSILLLNHTLRKYNCMVNITSAAEMVTLYGSHGRFSQVITNLVTNAIDAYKDKGGGPIDIELAHCTSGVNVLIKDRGTGIKKDDLNRIFDPLFTTKSPGQGTGLGLSIVNNIMTGDFEGSIEVDSKVGEGTTFILHFPAPPGGVHNGKKI